MWGDMGTLGEEGDRGQARSDAGAEGRAGNSPRRELRARARLLCLHRAGLGQGTLRAGAWPGRRRLPQALGMERRLASIGGAGPATSPRQEQARPDRPPGRAQCPFFPYRIRFRGGGSQGHTERQPHGQNTPDTQAQTQSRHVHSLRTDRQAGSPHRKLPHGA